MTCKMTEMTWPDFAAKVKKGSIVFLPVGSTEQHGPHLPLSTDAIIATGYAEMLAEEFDGIAAPTICFGYKSAPLSGGGPLFPGTLDLNGETLCRLTMDILVELFRDGVTKVFVVNGHSENTAFVLEAVDLVTRARPGVKVVEANWWSQISEEVTAKVFSDTPFCGWDLEHAAIAETSMMQIFAPHLVRTDRLHDNQTAKLIKHNVFPARRDIVPESGLLSIVAGYSPEKGRLLVESAMAGLRGIVKEEFM